MCIFYMINKGGINFRKFFHKTVCSRHSNFSALTKYARARARNVVWLYGCVFSTRDTSKEKKKEEDVQERTKRRMCEAEACLEHPGNGGPRWRPRSVVSRFLFLSVSFSQLNSRYRRPLPSCPFLVRVTPMEYVTQRVIYVRIWSAPCPILRLLSLICPYMHMWMNMWMHEYLLEYMRARVRAVTVSDHRKTHGHPSD